MILEVRHFVSKFLGSKSCTNKGYILFIYITQRRPIRRMENKLGAERGALMIVKGAVNLKKEG